MTSCGPTSAMARTPSSYRRYTRARLYVDKGSAVAGVVGWVKRGRTQPQNIEATHSGQAEKLKNWKTG